MLRSGCIVDPRFVTAKAGKWNCTDGSTKRASEEINVPKCSNQKDKKARNNKKKNYITMLRSGRIVDTLGITEKHGKWNCNDRNINDMLVLGFHLAGILENKFGDCCAAGSSVLAFYEIMYLGRDLSWYPNDIDLYIPCPIAGVFAKNQLRNETHAITEAVQQLCQNGCYNYSPVKLMQ